MLEIRQLDKSTPIPLYYQLKTVLNDAIESGDFAIGSAIPTEKELSEIYDISRTTVRQAIMEMVQEGKLYRVKSKGTFVARPKVNQDFAYQLRSYNDEIRDNGKVPSTEVLELDVVPIPERFAEVANLPLSSKAVCLYRKRFADGDPVVRVRTYLPYDKCSFLLSHNFNNESLYDVLGQDESTRIRHISRICEAIPASSEDVEILDMKRGQPVHFFTSFGYNSNNEILEYSLAYYRGDRNKFRIEINAG